MKQLNCPSCNAPMNISKADLNWSVHCIFCGSSSVVPMEYRSAPTSGNNFGHKSANNPLALNQKVASLLEKGKVIEAIKIYREEVGCGLAEAKDAIDAMRANMK